MCLKVKNHQTIQGPELHIPDLNNVHPHEHLCQQWVHLKTAEFTSLEVSQHFWTNTASQLANQASLRWHDEPKAKPAQLEKG